MKIFKIVICCLFLISNYQAVIANNKAKIQGNIFDGQTNTILPFVNVIVLNTDRGTMADASGHYELLLPAGSHELMFSMIGYKTLRQQIILIENQTLNCDVLLTPTVLYMPGVTIIAHKTAQQKQNESVSSLSFETKKIRDLPFSLNDVNRALKTLPGISSNNEKTSEFNVRGGSFEENLVQVDGVTIYRPFHLKALPNASISMLNMALMEKVNLITGGFPAKFGDKMSSVLEITYRNGDPKKFKSQFEVGVVNTNILLEGPLSKKCSWIIGFNKSYFEPSIKIMNYYFPEFLESIHGTPKFYDLQGKMNYNFNHQHQLSLLFLNAGDWYYEAPRHRSEYYTGYLNSYYTRMKTEDKSKFDANSGNTLFALQFHNRLINIFTSKASLSFYDEREELLFSSEYNAINKYYNRSNNEYRGFSNYNNIDRYGVNLHIKTFELKNDLMFKMTPYHEFETGFNFQSIKYLYHLNDLSERITYYNISNYPDTTRVDTLFYDDNYNDNISLESKTFKISGYLQDSWQINDNIFMNIGFRYDYFDFNKNITLSPRISCSYAFNNLGIFKLAWGHYYQSPMYDEFKFKTACSNNTQNQKAIHYIAGYQQKLSTLFNLKIDVYYKDYNNLIPYILRYGYKLSTQENNAEGFSKGIDIQLKYDIRNISGWLSYGFMIAKERIKDDNHGFYPRSTDQRHNLAIIIDWNIKDKWRVYGNFLYGSGFPSTPIVFDKELYRFVDGAMNSEYLPAYKRVDLRISRNFNFTWSECNFYFEIINVFNNENIFTYHHYGFDEHGNVTREEKRLLPITPNIGLKILL